MQAFTNECIQYKENNMSSQVLVYAIEREQHGRAMGLQKGTVILANEHGLSNFAKVKCRMQYCNNGISTPTIEWYQENLGLLLEEISEANYKSRIFIATAEGCVETNLNAFCASAAENFDEFIWQNTVENGWLAQLFIWFQNLWPR